MFLWVGEHTIYSKKVMAALIGVATMIFLPLAVSAQAGGPSNGDSGQSVSAVSEDVGAFSEGDIDFSSWGNASSSAGGGAGAASPSIGFGSYVKMLLVLALVVLVIILIFRYIKKAAGLSVPVDGDDTFLRHVSGVSLGMNKSVQIVTLLDKAYILGVSDAGVNLIGEVEDKELVNAMNLWSDKQNRTSKPRSFSDVLDLFMSRSPKASTGAAADSMSSERSRELLDGLHQQASRLSSEGEI